MCVYVCACTCARVHRKVEAAGLSSAVGLLSCELKIRNSRPFALKNVSEGESGALPSPEPPGEGKNLLGQGSCFSITRLQSSLKCCHAVMGAAIRSRRRSQIPIQPVIASYASLLPSLQAIGRDLYPATRLFLKIKKKAY